MKNKLHLVVVSVLVLIFSLFSAVEEEKKDNEQKKKNPRYILCSQMTKETLKGVKASKRRTGNGAVIVMTSPDPEAVKKLKEMVASCQAKTSPAGDTGKAQRDILSMEGVKVFETNLNNGIRLELSSDNPEIVGKIKRVRIPAYLRTRPKQDSEKK